MVLSLRLLLGAIGECVFSQHDCAVLWPQRRGKEPTEHTPEVILNNFTTRLGHSIGRMFAALFPQNPQFVGRQVATFHNQRDFVFFRFHRWASDENVHTQSPRPLFQWLMCMSRYIFKNEKKAGIQELGPRFTLKLRSLQKGTFDSKFGEYEWVLKVRASAFHLISICHINYGSSPLTPCPTVAFTCLPLCCCLTQWNKATFFPNISIFITSFHLLFYCLLLYDLFFLHVHHFIYSIGCLKVELSVKSNACGRSLISFIPNKHRCT